METVIIDEIQIGDFVECSCPSCYTITGCIPFCNINPCPSSDLQWEQVLDIVKQPAGNLFQIYLELTNNKMKFGWSKTLVVKRI